VSRGALGAWNTVEQNQLKAKAAMLAEVYYCSSSKAAGWNGTSRCATTSYAGAIIPESVHV
jgi:hypothetical protein